MGDRSSLASDSAAQTEYPATGAVRQPAHAAKPDLRRAMTNRRVFALDIDCQETRRDAAYGFSDRLWIAPPSSSHSCDVNQMFPSAPVVIPGSCVVPSLTEGRSANWVTIPLGVMRPIAGVVPGSVNHRFPFRAGRDRFRGAAQGAGNWEKGDVSAWGDAADLVRLGLGKPEVSVGSSRDRFRRAFHARNRELGDLPTRGDATDAEAALVHEPEVSVGPSVMAVGQLSRWASSGLAGVGIGNSVICPAGVMRPIAFPRNRVNHRFPSGPVAIPPAPDLPSGVGIGSPVSSPLGVI